MKKQSFTQKLTNFLNGRGFYIALALCIAAIGVSCWYLWRGGDPDQRDGRGGQRGGDRHPGAGGIRGDRR